MNYRVLYENICDDVTCSFNACDNFLPGPWCIIFLSALGGQEKSVMDRSIPFYDNDRRSLYKQACDVEAKCRFE